MAAQKQADAIHVALIGAGRQGCRLVRHCLNLPGVRLTAACDALLPRSVAMAQGLPYPAKVYVDYREMLAAEKDLQAAIIATPDAFHADQAVACMDAGLHVYCETPMHHTIEGARGMVLAARRTGRLLQIGLQRRSNPWYRAALDLVWDQGLLGAITYVYAQWHQRCRPPAPRPWPARLTGALQARCGLAGAAAPPDWKWLSRYGAGPVVALGCHELDVLHWFLGGSLQAVSASAGTDFCRGADRPDNAVYLLEWQTSTKAGVRTVLGCLRGHTALSAGGSYQALAGEYCTLYLSEDHQRFFAQQEGYLPLEVRERQAARGVPVVRCVPRSELWLLPWDGLCPLPSWFSFPVVCLEDRKPAHWYHLANFFDSIRGVARLNCPAETALPTLVALLRADDAAWARRRVELPAEGSAV